MPGYLAAAGLCRSLEEVLAQRTNKPIEQPDRSVGVPPGESFFLPPIHRYGDLRGQGQTKVDLAISSCVEIGGMQV